MEYFCKHGHKWVSLKLPCDKFSRISLFFSHLFFPEIPLVVARIQSANHVTFSITCVQNSLISCVFYLISFMCDFFDQLCFILNQFCVLFNKFVHVTFSISCVIFYQLCVLSNQS